MGDYSSFYKYEKFEVVGDELVSLGIFSVDADGTMPLVVKDDCDPQCGCPQPTYRWIETEDTVCIEVITRTLTGTPYCSGDDLYADVTVEESIDDGDTWEVVSTTPTLVEEGGCASPEVQYRWVAIGTTCSDGNKYQNNVKQVSTDGGHTWEDIVPAEYSASTLIESDSYDCGYRTSATTSATYCSNANQYVDVYSLVSRDYGVTWSTASTSTELIEEDVVECGFSARTISTATTCVGVDKHYLDEYQESRDTGTTWTTISSSTGSLIESNSYDCGYRTGTTSGDPYCQGYDKYVDVYYRTSTDGGTTWVTASTTPTLVEAQSEDCGYVPPTPTQYRWTQSGTTCIGYDKYQNNIKEQSTDGGETWTVVIPEEYSASTLIESQSTDCGYVPPTPSGNKFTLTLSDSSTVTAACDSTSAITSGEVAPQYSGSVVSAEIGDCVTSIGSYAFSNCSSLTSVTIPNTVTLLNTDAFSHSGLLTLNIPDSVETIRNYAVYDCLSLTSVTIGTRVTTIGARAFNRSSNLQSIYVLATTPPTLGNYAFDGTNNCPIYVPCDSVSAYQSAWDGLVDTSRIQAAPTQADYGGVYKGVLSNTQIAVIIRLSGSTLTSGNVSSHRDDTIKSFVGTGVTAIDDNTFSGFTMLTEANIASTVTTIGNNAFKDCPQMNIIRVNATTPPTLGSNAFDGTNNCPIQVPCGYASTYKSASGWSTYASRII